MDAFCGLTTNRQLDVLQRARWKAGGGAGGDLRVLVISTEVATEHAAEPSLDFVKVPSRALLNTGGSAWGFILIENVPAVNKNNCGMEPEDIHIILISYLFKLKESRPEEDAHWKTDSLEPDPSLFAVELRLNPEQGAAGKLEGVVYPQREVDKRQDRHILTAWIFPSRRLGILNCRQCENESLESKYPF